MGRYIVRRLLLLPVTLLLVSVLTFIIFVKLPVGNPAQRIAGRAATPQTVAAIVKVYGLDQPLAIQYLRFAKGIVPFPGWFLNDQYYYSYVDLSTVRSLIFQRLPVTVILAVGAAIIWLSIGIPLGVLSAIRPRSKLDRGSMIFVLAGISAPVFWVSYVLLFVFWFKLHWLPGSGLPPGESLFESVIHGRFVLPWIALALGYAAFYTRMTRVSLREAMSQDYIRTAKAKGVSSRRLVLVHGMRAGLTPLVTMLGLDLGTLLGGAIIVETIFNLPGIGAYSLEAVTKNDLPSIMGITLFSSFFIICANLIIDVIYAYLDPRVRLSTS